MDKVILANKKIGETPLDAINKLKTENLKLKNVKMAYAGRLDPMAEGLILILVGDECKRREKYQNLSKIYEFEILFGIETDTYDTLGKLTTNTSVIRDEIISKLKNSLSSFLGRQNQAYPPYSAARVNGRPLYYWARENKLDDIKIPKKQIEIYSLKLIDTKTISKDNLSLQVFKKLNKVHGDFRQDEIKALWQEYFKQTKSRLFLIAKLKVSCSSGTYVRAIINDLGKNLAVGATAFSIKRIAIGKYRLS